MLVEVVIAAGDNDLPPSCTLQIGDGRSVFQR